MTNTLRCSVALSMMLLTAAACDGQGGGQGGEGSTTDDTTGGGGGGDDSGGGGGGETITTDLTWHADIRPVVEESCSGCHSASGEGIGGFSLETYGDFQPWSMAARAAVEARTMPPFLASDDCAEYEGDFSLSDAQVSAVLEWVDGGMPEGDEADYLGETEVWAPETLERVDMTLRMAEPYTPQPVDGPDDYRCFVLEWPQEQDVWVTGYEFKPQNLRVVHHIVPFIIPEDDAQFYRDLDAADAGPGYTCYGSPGGDVLSLAFIDWLGAWAPGVGAAEAAPGTGLRIRPGSVVVMQVHYNMPIDDSVDTTDQSAVDIRFEEEPQGWASVQPWTDLGWVLGSGMEIPAETEGVEHDWEYIVQEGERFLIRAATLHMHTLGRSGRLSVVREDGSEDCVLDIPRYDFNWQRDYRLVEPVLAERGDRIRLSCTWDNPTDQAVAWGDGTGDEMCLGITELTGAPD